MRDALFLVGICLFVVLFIIFPIALLLDGWPW
jgi:hypothetical protein